MSIRRGDCFRRAMTVPMIVLLTKWRHFYHSKHARFNHWPVWLVILVPLFRCQHSYSATMSRCVAMSSRFSDNSRCASSWHLNTTARGWHTACEYRNHRRSVTQWRYYQYVSAEDSRETASTSGGHHWIERRDPSPSTAVVMPSAASHVLSQPVNPDTIRSLRVR